MDGIQKLLNSKICIKCQQDLPYSSFHKQSNSPDKYAYACKKCKSNYRKEHYQKNKFKQLEINKLWAKNNAEKNRQTRTKRAKRRYNEDPQHRLMHNVRKRISQGIRRGQKAGSAINDMGCTVIELMQHLETMFKPGMTWENYGKHWEVDHIIPLSTFDLTNREQFLKACNFINLQPLEANLNKEKSNKLNWTK